MAPADVSGGDGQRTVRTFLDHDVLHERAALRDTKDGAPGSHGSECRRIGSAMLGMEASGTASPCSPDAA